MVFNGGFKCRRTAGATFSCNSHIFTHVPDVCNALLFCAYLDNLLLFCCLVATLHVVMCMYYYMLFRYWSLNEQILAAVHQPSSLSIYNRGSSKQQQHGCYRCYKDKRKTLSEGGERW